MRRLVLIVSALLSLGFGAVAQEAEKYVPTPVTVSSDMVRVGNHLFYAHVVLARQTLYSIGKAYGVSSLDIIDSNPKLDLRNRPIHPGDVLLIPVRKQSPAPAAPKDTNSAPIAPRDSVSAPIDSISAPIQAPDTLSAPKDTVLAPQDTLAAPGDTILVAPEDSTVVVISEEDILPARPHFVYDYVDKVHVALLLPLSADSTPNSYYLNFYFGAMLAARDLGNEGIDLDVTVLDVNSSKDFAKVKKTLEQSDVIIGPVSTKDINRTLPHLPKGKFIISPMDPKTEAVTKENPVILAATPATTQIEDAVSWMKSNMGPADSLIIVKEANHPMSANSQYFIEHIDPVATGKTIQVSYALSEGIKMNEDFFVHHTHLKDTVTWVVAASEHDVFVKDVIRNVALQNYLSHNVYIYGPAKTRSTEMEEMCGARLHQSATYFINYDDPAVIRFINDFRALFQTEPDHFAFHGYDTLKYFVQICDNYGRNWPQKLDTYKMSGLQTNFKFFWDPYTEGFVNSGIRRIVYSPGFKVEVLE